MAGRTFLDKSPLSTRSWSSLGVRAARGLTPHESLERHVLLPSQNASSLIYLLVWGASLCHPQEQVTNSITNLWILIYFGFNFQASPMPRNSFSKLRDQRRVWCFFSWFPVCCGPVWEAAGPQLPAGGSWSLSVDPLTHSNTCFLF